MKLYLYILSIVIIGNGILFASEEPEDVSDQPELEQITEEIAEDIAAEQKNVPAPVPTPKTDKSPLWLASEKGDVAEVRFLLNTARTQIDQPATERQITPLMVAAEKVLPGSKKADDYFVITKLLLQKGADPRALASSVDKDGKTIGHETVLEYAEHANVQKRELELINKALRGQPIV